MVSNVYRPDRDEIAREILAYLVDHPDAQDTLDGIMQWWLLERKINYQKAAVAEALHDLIAKGFILEHKTKESPHTIIGLNRDKEQTTAGRLKKKPSPS